MIGWDDYFLIELVKKVFEFVKYVVFEIDMEDMIDMFKMMLLMMKAFMVGDMMLKDLLIEEEYVQVSEYFQQVGLLMMFVDCIKLMFLLVLGSGEDMMSFNFNVESSMVFYEMEFMKMVQEREMDIDGLEIVEFQMSMFDSIFYSVQAKMLMEVINVEGGGVIDQFDEMVKFYKDQDIYVMQSMMDEEGGIVGYEDLLLVCCNCNWIFIMEEVMKQWLMFFVVGVGYFGGEEGVIVLLWEVGYMVELFVD